MVTKTRSHFDHTLGGIAQLVEHRAFNPCVARSIRAAPTTMKIQIGSQSFPSKKAAIDHYRAIRDRNPLCIPIRGQDRIDLLELLAIHPNRLQKIGTASIMYFFTDVEPTYGTVCFWIKRKDGSVTDFSFLGAINGANQRSDVLQALRYVVQPQIIEFREAEFAKGSPVCPLSGKPLYPKTCHVDHERPFSFSWLVDRWLQSNRLEFKDIFLEPSKDGCIGSRLSDSCQKDSWERFHKQHARLRLLAAEENLKLSKS